MFAMMLGLMDVVKSNKRIEEPWSFWLLVFIELLCELGIGWALAAMWWSVVS
jgi:hypothetical protein